MTPPITPPRTPPRSLSPSDTARTPLGTASSAASEEARAATTSDAMYIGSSRRVFLPQVPDRANTQPRPRAPQVSSVEIPGRPLFSGGADYPDIILTAHGMSPARIDEETAILLAAMRADDPSITESDEEIMSIVMSAARDEMMASVLANLSVTHPDIEEADITFRFHEIDVDPFAGEGAWDQMQTAGATLTFTLVDESLNDAEREARATAARSVNIALENVEVWHNSLETAGKTVDVQEICVDDYECPLSLEPFHDMKYPVVLCLGTAKFVFQAEDILRFMKTRLESDLPDVQVVNPVDNFTPFNLDQLMAVRDDVSEVVKPALRAPGST